MGRGSRLTWIANHSILGPNVSNDFLIVISPLTPRVVVLLRNFRKFSIKLRAFFVILLQPLASMRTECIFVQRIDVYRRANLVYGSEIYRRVSG